MGLLPKEGLFLLNFDWISPLIAVAQNSMRPTYIFAVSMDAIGGNELLDILDSNKIEHWGHLIIHECWVVSVPADKAYQVKGIFKKMGIEIYGK